MANWGRHGNVRDWNHYDQLLTPYTHCEGCGNELDRRLAHQGPPKRFCRDACRKRAARAAEKKRREAEQ